MSRRDDCRGRGRLQRAALRANEEQGIALVSVALVAAILFLLASIMLTRGIVDIGQTGREARWDRALHVAEAGIDHAIFQLDEDEAWDTGETAPAFADRIAEEEWVRDEADANTPVAAPGGDWSVVKPDNTQYLYAVGYVPSFADADVSRVVRVAYDHAPFGSLDVAILTDGDLVISGDPELLGDSGSAHANGNVTISGNPTANGYIASSGTYDVSGSPVIGDPANSGGGRPPRDVPLVDPRESYDTSQYDLCPNGQVRTGPDYPGPEAPNASSTPCLGTLLDDTTDGNPYRGWIKTGDDASQGAKWSYSGNTAYDGVYYVYQGGAFVSGNPGTAASPWRATILAEAIASGAEPHCSHIGGDIEISGNVSIEWNDGARPMVLIAGRDLEVSGNPDNTFAGLLAAHEQFTISGNPNLRVKIIANDYCDTPGSPVADDTVQISGNATFQDSGDLDIPFGDRIQINHWQEL